MCPAKAASDSPLRGDAGMPAQQTPAEFLGARRADRRRKTSGIKRPAMKRAARYTVAGTGPLAARRGAQGQGLAGGCGAFTSRRSASGRMQDGSFRAVTWAVWVMAGYISKRGGSSGRSGHRSCQAPCARRGERAGGGCSTWLGSGAMASRRNRRRAVLLTPGVRTGWIRACDRLPKRNASHGTLLRKYFRQGRLSDEGFHEMMRVRLTGKAARRPLAWCVGGVSPEGHAAALEATSSPLALRANNGKQLKGSALCFNNKDTIMRSHCQATPAVGSGSL